MKRWFDCRDVLRGVLLHRASNVAVSGMLGLLLVAACPVSGATDTNAKFYGGAYDGWDVQAMTGATNLGGPQVTLSSLADQMFDWRQGQGTVLLAPVTIQDDNPRAITNLATLAIDLPALLPALRYDPSFAPAYSGSAAGKVGAASVAEDGRTLRIPVIQDFGAAESLMISGLAVRGVDLSLDGSGRLALNFSGTGPADVYDDKTIGVRVGWLGGAFDGWDANALLACYPVCRRGTIFIIK